jgi:hypothetical protein
MRKKLLWLLRRLLLVISQLFFLVVCALQEQVPRGHPTDAFLFASPALGILLGIALPATPGRILDLLLLLPLFGWASTIHAPCKPCSDSFEQCPSGIYWIQVIALNGCWLVGVAIFTLLVRMAWRAARRRLATPNQR